MLIMCIKAFVVGGIICVIGQILIDKTKLTPAKILVLFVCLGVVLGKDGISGIVTGGLGACAGGVTIAVLSALAVAFITKSKDKN